MHNYFVFNVRDMIVTVTSVAIVIAILIGCRNASGNAKNSRITKKSYKITKSGKTTNRNASRYLHNDNVNEEKLSSKEKVKDALGSALSNPFSKKQRNPPPKTCSHQSSVRSTITALPFSRHFLRCIPRMRRKRSCELMLRPYNLRFHTCLETQTVDVINPTDDVLAIKSKCSDNNIYSVDPVYFLLNPRHELTVNVRRESKMFKVDKLVFAVLKVPKGVDVANAREMFIKDYEDKQLLFVLPLFTSSALMSYDNDNEASFVNDKTSISVK